MQRREKSLQVVALFQKSFSVRDIPVDREVLGYLVIICLVDEQHSTYVHYHAGNGVSHHL